MAKQVVDSYKQETQMVNELSKLLNIRAEDARKVWRGVFIVLMKTFLSGKGAKIKGFGIFEFRFREVPLVEFKGREPQRVRRDYYYYLHFRPTEEVKKLLNKRLREIEGDPRYLLLKADKKN